MTSKEIYQSIDQSKISPKGKDFLQKAEKSTKGFTIQNDKLDSVMKKLYADLKAKKPEALKDVKTKTVETEVKVPTTKAEQKKEPKKKTKTVKRKVKKATGKKKNTKPTKTPSEPKEGKKEHISTRAKKLADKEGISFKEARARLSKEAKEQIKKDEKEANKELEKLLKFVRKDSFEDGEKYPKIYGKQDPEKASLSADAKRMAKPVGKRISKDGNTYYEYRDNRSDRNSRPTKEGYKYVGKTPPYLEAGGTLPTPFGQAGLVGETGAMNEVDLFAMGGDLPQGVHQYYANTYNPAYPIPHGYAKGGVMKTYDDFGKDYDAFTDYVMDRISLEERRKIRKQWEQSKSKMQWQDYLLKEVNKKSMAKGGEIDAFIMKFVKDAPASNLRVDAEELTAKLKKGGKLGFDGLAKKVAKRYEGKPVKKQFQNEYGKTYSKAEAMEVGRKVAGKVYRQQQSMEKGGEVIEYSKVYEILKDKIDDAVEDIESTYEQAYNTKGEEVEYKSRDGFIPFTNGGYSSRWFEYSGVLEGSGMNLPTASLDEKIEEFRERNRQYGFERFEEEYPEIVEELGGIENVNYSALEDAGYSNEADDLDMFMQDDEDSVMMEVEAFYYNPNNDRGEDGKHTIQLSGVVNLEAPYHRSGNLEDYIEERFTFDSYKELEDKLDKGLAKVVSWFEGDMYDKNPRELKIRRMAKGGKTKRSKHSLMQDRRRVSKESWEVAYQKRKNKMAKGGEIDLFEDYENLPENLSLIVNKYAEMDEMGEMDYAQTKNFLNEVQSLGYTFDYGLDNQPYNLRKMEAGGTLPTPFGQAGLVGETGTLNEMELFAMGGGLPQGVHQYYANTYNPAYPTPHGYAKGGELQGAEISRLRKNIMGTLSFDLKVGSMRKAQDFIVYPMSELEDKINIQSSKKFGIISIEDGRGILSKGSGNTFMHLRRDMANRNVITFKLTSSQLEELKNEIRKTGGSKVGDSVVFSDNSGASLLAKGGKTQGYNDKLDESLGNTKGKRSTKEQNYKDRRNESEAMEKKGGKRKYARVKTMDKGNRKKKMKTPMTLAKAIRREGEKWQDAVKRASAMIRKDS